MAITRISYHVLPVGQGNGTLVTYHNGNDNVVDTVIMDFGSDMSTWSTSGQAALALASTVLNGMKAPRISAVYFSHSDYDHISLMDELVEPFKSRTELKIDDVFFNGKEELFTKDGTNVLHKLVKFLPRNQNPESFGANYSSFCDTSSEIKGRAQGYCYYILMANAAAPRRAETLDSGAATGNAYQINTESLVVVSDIKGHQFVMAGDATAQTLKAISTVIADNKSARDHLGNVFHATIPHHGSFATTATGKGLGKGGDWETNLSDYTRRLKAKSVSVTAGVENKHKHPSAYIVQSYWFNTDKNDLYQDPKLGVKRLHLTTQYYDPEWPLGEAKSWPPKTMPAAWRTMQTAYAIFTNNYWYDGGRLILPPLDGKSPENAIIDPADLAATDLPSEVSWEISCRLGKDGTVSAIEMFRWPPKAAARLGRAILQGGLAGGLKLPTLRELRRQSGATRPVMTIPVSDKPEPRRRARPRG